MSSHRRNLAVGVAYGWCSCYCAALMHGVDCGGPLCLLIPTFAGMELYRHGPVVARVSVCSGHHLPLKIDVLSIRG